MATDPTVIALAMRLALRLLELYLRWQRGGAGLPDGRLKEECKRAYKRLER